MKSVEQTWDLLDRHCAPLQSIQVELVSALGRILREDAVADADQPPFSRSAMDGYLVRLNEPSSVLKMVGEVTPGMGPRMPESGCALRVFTGSAVPDEGAAVVMQEDAELDGETVILRVAPAPLHVRLQGSHGRRGDVLVSAGSRLTPGRIALLATAGITRPKVSRIVQVAHVITGSEIVGSGEQPAPGQIRDSNSPMILALLRDKAGVECSFHRRLAESPAALKATIEEVLGAGIDLLIVSGGASVSERDHTKPVLRDTGFELLVEQVNCRPGKPLTVGIKKRLPAFGLPGNPLSHFVCFHLFVRRAIARLTGEAPPALLRMRVEDAHRVKPNPRESWLPCRLISDEAGMAAQILPWRDSSDLTALAHVHGLLRVPSEGLNRDGVGEFLPTGEFEP